MDDIAAPATRLCPRNPAAQEFVAQVHPTNRRIALADREFRRVYDLPAATAAGPLDHHFAWRKRSRDR